jgi:hypothetical protein
MRAYRSGLRMRPEKVSQGRLPHLETASRSSWRDAGCEPGRQPLEAALPASSAPKGRGRSAGRDRQPKPRQGRWRLAGGNTPGHARAPHTTMRPGGAREGREGGRNPNVRNGPGRSTALPGRTRISGTCLGPGAFAARLPSDVPPGRLHQDQMRLPERGQCQDAPDSRGPARTRLPRYGNPAYPHAWKEGSSQPIGRGRSASRS